MVLKNSENFVLRPSLNGSFREAQKRLIRDYFVKTVGMHKFGHHEIDRVPGLVEGAGVEKLNLLGTGGP